MNKQKTLKGEEMADKLGVLGPQEWHSNKFPEFLFRLI